MKRRSVLNKPDFGRYILTGKGAGNTWLALSALGDFRGWLVTSSHPHTRTIRDGVFQQGHIWHGIFKIPLSTRHLSRRRFRENESKRNQDGARWSP